MSVRARWQRFWRRLTRRRAPALIGARPGQRGASHEAPWWVRLALALGVIAAIGVALVAMAVIMWLVRTVLAG